MLLDGEEAFESRLEGLNFDSTVSTLGQYSQFENVAISVKRVFKRGEVIVQMVGPGGTLTHLLDKLSSPISEICTVAESMQSFSGNAFLNYQYFSHY